MYARKAGELVGLGESLSPRLRGRTARAPHANPHGLMRRLLPASGGCLETRVGAILVGPSAG